MPENKIPGETTPEKFDSVKAEIEAHQNTLKYEEKVFRELTESIEKRKKRITELQDQQKPRQ